MEDTAMKLYVGDDIDVAKEVPTSVEDMLHMARRRREVFEQICKESVSAEFVCFGGDLNGRIVAKPFTDGRIVVLPDDQGITIWGRDPKDVMSFGLLYCGNDLTDFPEILRVYENFCLPDEALKESGCFRNLALSFPCRKFCSC